MFKNFSMFKYGRKAGWLGVATIVLALIPVVIAVVVVPGLPESMPMRFDAAGEVTRWGSRYELLVPPVMSVEKSISVQDWARPTTMTPRS